MALARLDVGLGLLGERDHVLRDRRVVGRHLHHAGLEPAPHVRFLPSAVEHCLGAGDVVAVPIVDDRGQMRLGRELGHVGGLADRPYPPLLRDLRRGGRIGVLQDNVRALVDQRLGGVALLARVVPGVDPDHLDLGLRVHLAQREREGIDAADHLRNRERGDVADDVRLGHLARDQARDRPPLVEAGEVGRDVGRALVTRAVLELHLGELLGDLDGRVHEAE